MGGKKKEPEPHKIFVMTTVLCSLESEAHSPKVPGSEAYFKIKI